MSFCLKISFKLEKMKCFKFTQKFDLYGKWSSWEEVRNKWLGNFEI